MSLSEKFKAQEEEAKKEGIASQGGGDWFKLVEGDNVIRILTEPEMFFEKFKVGICYTDCGYEGTAKFMAFVLDKKDGKVKLAKLPYTVGSTIAEYEQDEDYNFEGFPMPYNVKIKAVGAGTKEVKYTVTPSPKREDVAAEVLTELKKRKPVSEIIKKMKEKQKDAHVADGTWQKEQDRKSKLKAELEAAKGSGAVDEGYPTDEEIDPADIPF
jgi:hypothetical protein